MAKSAAAGPSGMATISSLRNFFPARGGGELSLRNLVRILLVHQVFAASKLFLLSVAQLFQGSYIPHRFDQFCALGNELLIKIFQGRALLTNSVGDPMEMLPEEPQFQS
jgi:hypothetical protein